MAIARKSARDVVRPDGIGVVVYAEKERRGWEAIIGAMIDSGWIVTGSWPIDTEMRSRGSRTWISSPPSSVHMICRPRENTRRFRRAPDEIGDWRDLLQELPVACTNGCRA